MFGVPSPPPYADPSTTGARILNGVNYASAAAGILDESGRNYVLYHTVLHNSPAFSHPLILPYISIEFL